MSRVYYTFIICFFLFSACEKSPIPDCFKNTGAVTSEGRDVDDFNSILLRHNINLHLKQSDKNEITVKAGSNLMGKIKTEVNDQGQLEIRNDNSCNWVRSYSIPIDVYVEFQTLDSLEYRSTGDVSAEGTLFLDSLKIDVQEGAGKIELDIDARVIFCGMSYGTADVVLSGFSEISYMYSASYGLIDCRNLESKFVYVNNKSSNDLYLFSSTELGATIENIGNIYYAGNPATIDLNRIGTGELIKLEE